MAIVKEVEKELTLEELVKVVADDFLETMDVLSPITGERRYDTFREMKESFWWTSKDVRDEVEAIMGYAGCWVTVENEVRTASAWFNCSYREFMNKVYAIFKAMNRY